MRGEVLTPKVAQEHLVSWGLFGVQLEARPFKILHRVDPPILVIQFLEGFGDGEAEGADAALPPESEERASQRVSSSDEEDATYRRSADLGKGGMVTPPFGGPAPKEAHLHKAQIAVPFQTGAFKVLDRTPRFAKHLSERQAEDGQTAMFIEKLAEAVSEGVSSLAEEDRRAGAGVCADRRGGQHGHGEHEQQRKEGVASHRMLR